MSNRTGLTYEDAGVSIERGDSLVDKIKSFAKQTYSEHTLAGIGGFASLSRIPSRFKKPVLVSGTDGVGTKLKIAFLTGEHGTVGIDLVAMCVNDILTTGAQPLFFLDYFATGRLHPDTAARVVQGIAAGCMQAGCALLGGETAEMPGFYPDNEYDLAGFVVGVADEDALLDGTRTEAGDVVLGIASSGLHSNGYSLARKVVFELAPVGLDTRIGERTLQEWLLEPTRIYRKSADAVATLPGVRSLAHITGGGLPGNLPRVVPDRFGIELFRNSWQVPHIFSYLQERGKIADDEMLRVFNMGIGMTVVVAAADATKARRALEAAGEQVFEIGRVVDSAENGSGDADPNRVWFRP